MKPEDRPNSLTAAELLALEESSGPETGPTGPLFPGPETGPTGPRFPSSVAPGEATPWLDARDPLTDQVAGLLGTNATPGVSDLERSLLGDLADPVRRAAVADLAVRIKAAVDAGATEASRYEAGRIPEARGEVIYRSAPAEILAVLDAGDPMSRLDLLQYRGGRPEAFSAVVHDLSCGWSWLGEGPPPDPTGEDRVRAAVAAGKPVPGVGTPVRLVRAKPRSYRGTEFVYLRARVAAVVDVVGGSITLDLEVLDALGDGLDPTTASGLVRGVEGPVDGREGWSTANRESLFVEVDRRTFDHVPCERCGSPLRHDERVKLCAHTWDDRDPQAYAVVCRTCADQLGRLAFVAPAPAEAS